MFFFFNVISLFLHRYLELNRDELFEKARGEIINEVVDLSLISVKDWEKELGDALWVGISHFIIENIYLQAMYEANKTNNQG